MSDKLPQFVEDWIADHSQDLYGSGTCWLGMIDVDDLRTFLAQFVLCQKAPINIPYFMPQEYQIGIAPTHTSSEPCGALGIITLHAPAKGLPEASDTQEQTP